MKKLISLLLALVILLSCVCIYSGAAEDVYSTIVTASDFQGSSESATNRFRKILEIAKNDGVNVNAGLFGGDYSSSIGIGPGIKIEKIKNAFSEVYPSVDKNNMLFVQGNHDLDSKAVTKTGLHDFGSFLVYSMNEDEFYRPQGGGSYIYGEAGIKVVAEKLRNALSGLVAKKETRPVFLITHAPLHHSRRSSYSDVLFSKLVFDPINEAAENLDIIFLFGHNHSSDYDDYIGGAVNYLEKGSEIRIPIPSQDAAGENGYTNEKLNFTYMNCGYVGYSSNGTKNGSTKTLTASFFRLSPTKITVTRYSENGVYSTETIKKINTTSPAVTKATVKSDDPYIEDTYSSGVTELKAGNHYIIGRELTGTGGLEASAAKSEEKYTGKKTLLSLKDREVNAVYNEAAGNYSITTDDKSVVYVAKEIGGKIYLQSAENGLFISIRETDPDDVYTSGRMDIVLVDEAHLDSNAVCTYSDGMLKFGKYYIYHSSSYYYYAKHTECNIMLFEGEKTEKDIIPEEPEVKPDTENCSHICHQGGFMGIIWQIVRFVIKLFGIEKTCACGVHIIKIKIGFLPGADFFIS